MTRAKRLVAAIVIAAALAPGIWLHAPPRSDANERSVHFELLAVGERTVGPFTVDGAWRMTSPHFWFGGYSALLPMGDGTLLAGSDRGWTLRFAPPGARARSPDFARFGPDGERRLTDLEALTRDPVSGTVWAAFEFHNAIARHETGGTFVRRRPSAMRRWPLNGGPEAMVRLADGRFVVLAEAADDGLHPGLLFPGDPVAGALPLRFRYRTTGGYAPVDLAQLPDGRVLVLERRVEWRLPPGFAGRVVLADPAAIRRDGVWRGTVLAKVAPPLPIDNYEGLAVVPGADGRLTVWLISDDNSMAIQRTLLLKLGWRP